MNSYARHLEPAIIEIRAFAATEEGRKWDSQWYAHIEDLVARTKSAGTEEAAESLLDVLVRYIVDSGPIGKSFAPSVDTALAALQAKRKHQSRKRRDSNDP
jgi:hypothetical protein